MDTLVKFFQEIKFRYQETTQIKVNFMFFLVLLWTIQNLPPFNGLTFIAVDFSVECSIFARLTEQIYS